MPDTKSSLILKQPSKRLPTRQQLSVSDNERLAWNGSRHQCYINVPRARRPKTIPAQMCPRNSYRWGVIGVNREQVTGDRTVDHHPGHGTIRHHMMTILASWDRMVQHPLGRICFAHLVFRGLTSAAPLSCRRQGTLVLQPHPPCRLHVISTDQPLLEICNRAKVVRTLRRHNRLRSPRCLPCRRLGPLGCLHHPMPAPTALQLAPQQPWFHHLAGPRPLRLLDSARRLAH